MREFLKKHRLGAILVLVLLWCLWYSRPVDVHFLLGGASPRWAIGSVRDATSAYSTQSRMLDPVDAQEAEALTAELLAELEPLRFHRSPLEPLLRILPPMGGGLIRYGEAGKKEYDLRLTFYDQQPEAGQELLSLRFCIKRWSYGPYDRLPLFVSHGHEAGRELGAFLWKLAEEQSSS